MTTKTRNRTEGRKRLLPHQEAKTPVVVVQPPASMAHLTGRKLYNALTADQEIWDAERIAAESKREVSTVDDWITNYNSWKRGKIPRDDNVFITPLRYFGTTPVYLAGDVRDWLMRTRRMDRRGVGQPYKSAGRPKGLVERGPRKSKRDALVDAQSVEVLARYEQIEASPDAPTSAVARREIISREFDLTDRQVTRRLDRGRKLRVEQAVAAKREQMAQHGRGLAAAS